VSSTRLWILALTGVAFLAGTASGILLERTQNPAPEIPFQDYRDRIVARYELEPLRARALDLLLVDYQRKLDEVEARYQPTYQAAMEDDLTALGIQYEVLLRDKVLHAAAREQYEKDVLGTLPSQPAPASGF
jgi:hypothetical protein